MLLILVAIFIFASSMALEKPVYNVDEAEQLFHDFMETHHKVYSSEEERQRRFEVFAENLKEINRLNSMGSSLRVISKFSDLTTEEFVKGFTGYSELVYYDGAEDCDRAPAHDFHTNDAPSALDFRSLGIVAPVKNQLSCPSCWAFAATATIESQYAMKYKKLVSLSDQQVMDCTLFNTDSSGHCNGGGFADVAFFQLMRTKRGLSLESDYPYQSEDQYCRITDPTKFSVKVTSCTKYLLTEEGLKEALYRQGPLTVYVEATSWQHYGGLIHNVTDCLFTGDLNHAVLLVGYGTTDQNEDYWLIKNSWGPEWGEEGYIRISRGQNSCGIVEIANVGVEVE